MDKIESLNHTKWDCKYHIVFIPKGRRKVLYGQLKQPLGEAPLCFSGDSFWQTIAHGAPFGDAACAAFPKGSGQSAYPNRLD